MTESEPALAVRLAQPVDGASYVAFRILFGLMLLVGMGRFVAEGWVTTLFVEPTFFFKYMGFEWVPVWPAWGMYLHYAVLGALALMIALGVATRLSAAAFFLGFSFVELMDVTNYLNHYYLVSLLALALAIIPAKGAGGLRLSIPRWGLWLLRFHIAVVYLGAALAKTGPDWLLYGQPMNLWMAARSELPLIGPLIGAPEVALVMSWAGFLYDLCIVPLLLWRRSRPFAYALVLLFHGMTHLFFDIGLFPFVMTAATTLFFEPDWPRRFAAALHIPLAPPSSAAGRTSLPTWAMAMACVWCLLHVAIPLRHFLLPGDVLWNEAGMRWSWKVMVREKSGAITYRVSAPKTGRTMHVSPNRYLTWRQANEMSGQPDLILQLAHHIAEDFQAKGYGDDIQVRVDALVSLNGRPPSPMIDPTVDLAQVSDTVGSPSWVLPAPEGPPGRVRAPASPLARWLESWGDRQ